LLQPHSSVRLDQAQYCFDIPVYILHCIFSPILHWPGFVPSRPFCCSPSIVTWNWSRGKLSYDSVVSLSPIRGLLYANLFALHLDELDVLGSSVASVASLTASQSFTILIWYSRFAGPIYIALQHRHGHAKYAKYSFIIA
jgi:hypothetical protein